MSDRKISWHIRDGKRVAGIEDTGRGWAVVDSEGKLVMSAGGYSKSVRLSIEDYFQKYLERMR